MRGNRKVRQNRLRADTAGLPGFNFMESLEFCLKFIMIIVLIILSSLMFIFIHDSITQAEYFSLKKIHISGCRQISKSDIIKQAGIFSGENIFAINLFKVKKRLVFHEWIADASVERKMPGELFIKIKEQNPVAAVEVGDKNAVLINDKGVPFTERKITERKITDSEITDSENCNVRDRNSFFVKLNIPFVKGLELKEQHGVYGFSGKLFDSVMEFLSGSYDIAGLLNILGRVEQIKIDRDMGLDLKITGFPKPDSNIKSDFNIKKDFEINKVSEKKMKPENADFVVNLRLGFGHYKSRYKKLNRIIDYIKSNQINKKISAIDLSDLKNVTVKFKETENRGIEPDSIRGGV